MTVIDRALEGVSDGAPVDWAALEGNAADEFDLECLRWLRLIGQIEAVHRTTSDDLQVSPTATVQLGVS